MELYRLRLQVRRLSVDQVLPCWWRHCIIETDRISSCHVMVKMSDS